MSGWEESYCSCNTHANVMSDSGGATVLPFSFLGGKKRSKVKRLMQREGGCRGRGRQPCQLLGVIKLKCCSGEASPSDGCISGNALSHVTGTGAILGSDLQGCSAAIQLKISEFSAFFHPSAKRLLFSVHFFIRLFSTLALHPWLSPCRTDSHTQTCCMQLEDDI